MTDDPQCECTCGKPGCASAPRSRTPIRHGSRNRWTKGCRCPKCRQWRLDIRDAPQQATLLTAIKMGHAWTGPELEIVTRPDLTAKEAALMLGRSFRAIETIRYKCRRDPRKAHLLGAPSTSEESA